MLNEQTASTWTATLSSPPLSTELWELELHGKLEGRMQLHHRCSMQCTRHLACISLRSTSVFYFRLFHLFCPAQLSHKTACYISRAHSTRTLCMVGKTATVNKTMLGLLQSARASIQQRQCWAYCKVQTPAFNKDKCWAYCKVHTPVFNKRCFKTGLYLGNTIFCPI